MKRVGKIFLLLIVAVLFGYLLVIDYPETMRSLTPNPDTAANGNVLSDTSMVLDIEQEPESTAQDANEPDIVDAQEPDIVDAQELDIEAIRAQIPNTKTVLFVGSIRQSVYEKIYPALSNMGYTGTLLFFNGHLTGDYQQMSTPQFQELVNAGWSFAMGGIYSDLSNDDWQNSLLEGMSLIEYRSGVRPSVYYFQSGEYRPELETILQEEGFSALYYSAEDAENAAEGTSDLRKICYIPFSAEKDLQALLDQAWSYNSAAFGAAVDSDGEELTAEAWNELLSLLSTDGRFDVMSQSDWLNSELDNRSDRAELVAAVLASDQAE